MPKKAVALRLFFSSLAVCGLVGDAQAQEIQYAVKATDDSMVLHRFQSLTIRICHTSADTRIVRITTPAMGLTEILITGGGHVCGDDETPDFVLSSRECVILSGEFKGSLDETCDNK
jgi:hypothetical protein